jgi:hypothetical protein
MSSFVDTGRRAPRPGTMPPYVRPSGRIRAFVASALASMSPAPEKAEEPRPRPTGHEAMIAAARSAFGGTIAW